MLLITSDLDFRRLEAKVDLLIRLTRLTVKLETKEMTILDDIQDAEDKINERLTSITNFQVATKAALDAKDAKIAELTSDLLAAHNSGGATAGQLQAILDKANAMLNTADNAAQTEAIFANTAAPPAPTPEPVDPAPAPAPETPPVDATAPVENPAPAT